MKKKILISILSILALSSCKDKRASESNKSTPPEYSTATNNMFTLADTFELNAGPNSIYGSKLKFGDAFLDTIITESQSCNSADTTCLYQKIKIGKTLEGEDSIMWPSASSLIWFNHLEKHEISSRMPLFNDSMSAYAFDGQKMIVAYFGIKDNNPDNDDSLKSNRLPDSLRYSVYACKFDVNTTKFDTIRIFEDGIQTDSYEYFESPVFNIDTITFRNPVNKSTYKVSVKL